MPCLREVLRRPWNAELLLSQLPEQGKLSAPRRAATRSSAVPLCSAEGIGQLKDGAVTRLPRVTAAELLRALGRDGWFETRQTGSHKILRHSTKPGPIAVPFHRRDMKTGTLEAILKQAGLTADDLRRLL